MKKKITELVNSTMLSRKRKDELIESLSSLYDSSINWSYVKDKEPPKNIVVLAKDTDCNIHLCQWREAHEIFTVQCKGEDSFDWQWKII